MSKASIRAKCLANAALRRTELLGEEIGWETAPAYVHPYQTSRVSPNWTAATNVVATERKSAGLSGWDKAAANFDESTQKSAMVRIDGIRRPIGPAGFTGADNERPTGDARQLRANLVSEVEVEAPKVTGTSKADRNWNCLAEGGGVLRPLMDQRRPNITPGGLALAWRQQNHFKPLWNEG